MIPFGEGVVMARFHCRLAMVAPMVVVALAACSGGSNPAPSSESVTVTPSSSAAGPVQLTMMHIDGDSGLDPAVDWFTDRVLELSNGAVVVRPSFGCCGQEVDVEQQLVDKVAKGEAELGWVGTRAFDELGAAYAAPRERIAEDAGKFLGALIERRMAEVRL